METKHFKISKCNKSKKDRLQKSVDAYNIYKNKDGWHRDYIDIMIWFQSCDKGVFVYDYKETLYSFQMKGDPNIAFQRYQIKQEMHS